MNDSLMPHTYPVARSLAHRVCEALRRKLFTTATVTTGQIVDKFNSTPREVTTFLAGAVQHGWLQRDNIGSQQHAYSPGRAMRALMQADAIERQRYQATPPAVGQRLAAQAITASEAAAVKAFIGSQPDAFRAPYTAAPDPAAAPASRPASRQSADRRRPGPKSGPTITPDQLIVRTGMPTPTRGGRVRVTDYSPILASLTSADISVDFPIAHLRNVRYAAQVHAQANPEQRFAVGVAHDDASRGRIKRLA